MAQIERFGTLSDGRVVERVELSGGDLKVGLLTFGARLQYLDHAGSGDLSCGTDDLAAYEDPKVYHGPIIAPVINRISGATTQLAGRTLTFEANQENAHCLHSGSAGSHLAVWDIEDASETSVTFSLHQPHGVGGFPGNRHITARYGVSDNATLRLEITAKTDALTFMNPGFHPYWNLDASDSWAGHRLRVSADRYLPSTSSYFPDGRILSVQDTEFDLRDGVELKGLIDNNFCLTSPESRLAEASVLTGKSGRQLEIWTDSIGLQVYTGDPRGIALEPQNWPDSPNKIGFPSIELGPNETFLQRSEMRFRNPA